MTTKTISSPSASTTTKAKVAKAGTSGPPPKSIEPFSVDTSKHKRWYVTFMDGRVARIDVEGSKNGRISFSRGQRGDGGEVRIYRTAGSKVFDAVLTEVKHVQSEFVEAREMIGAPEPKAKEEDAWFAAKSMMGKYTAPVPPLPTPLPYELLDPIEQDKLEDEKENDA